MANVKNAILKAKIENVIYEVLVKTNAANVYVDDSTTLAAKLTSILADIATKANAEEMTTALAGKAAVSHTHEQSEINGLVDLLATLATNTAVTEAIDALRQEMLGDTPVEAYNTFTEMAKYIEEHQEAADALTAAIGLKADKTALDALQAQVDGLGTLAGKSEVAEDDLTDELKEKVNAAAEGNHAHLNKTELDLIQSGDVAKWNAAEQNAKDYADGLAVNYDAKGSAAQALTDAKAYADGLAGNYDANGSAAQALTDAKAYVDGLASNYDAAGSAAQALTDAKAYTDTQVATKGTVYYSATQPDGLTENDLWVQLV